MKITTISMPVMTARIMAICMNIVKRLG